MDTVAFLLDAPEQETTRHPIAKLGKYKDPRYGKFEITLQHYESWKKNLAGPIQGGRIPIDYDHAADRGGSTEAAGWITGLTLDDKLVMASIEWTPDGAKAVKDRRWLYVSPTYTAQLRDEQQNGHGPALIGTALTNRPFLRRGMPAISLSEQDADMPAAEVDEDEPASFDSPGTMPDLTKLNEALGLDPGADEAKTLDAVQALKQSAEQPAEDTLTLDDRAKAEGKIVLTADEVADLQSGAQAGEQAAKELKELRFETAFTTALSEGKVDARPETRERFSKIFALDEAIALDTLKDLAPVVKLDTRGTGGGDNESAPEGVDPDEHRLDQRVRAHMAEHNITDYTVALSAVQAADTIALGA